MNLPQEPNESRSRLRRRPWQWWVIVGLWGAFVAAAGGALIWATHRVQPFDRAVWNDETRLESGIRLTMADDLLRRGTLRGLSRAEVVALLGEPPSTSYFQEADLVYWLGPERGYFSIDSEWLIVTLPGDRVADARIVRD